MNTKTCRIVILLLTVLQFGVVSYAQSINLLRNPDANDKASSWQTYGEAAVERTSEGNFCFVVRNGGHFFQDVELPKGSEGQYAVLIGHGSGERINADGAITDLPYLYGYMMNRNEIQAYLQGQNLLGRIAIKDQWVQMSGIFKVPSASTTIRFFLKQALHKDIPHNGSAARFDNLGLYLFATKEEAEAFVAQGY